jgi:excisionase family DNA binding protein
MATPGILKTMGLMTTSEAADTIGIHRNTIWNAIKQGHIPANKIGNAIALDPKDVAEFRAKYLRGEVTTTSPEPAKKGRPKGSTNRKTGFEATCDCGVCDGALRKLTCERAASAATHDDDDDDDEIDTSENICECAVCGGGERKLTCDEITT